MNGSLQKQCVAEMIGAFALIFIGVGALQHSGGDLLAVALAHGLTMAVMVSATAGISGGHLNPAVTIGVLTAGRIEPLRAVFYIASQLIGAVLAGLLLLRIFGDPAVVARGTPALAESVTASKGIVIEAVLTFFLVFVFFGTVLDSRAPKIGGLAIGLTITLDILFGGPLTGAAMNPARTFGPAVAASHWDNHLVYWAGPLLGGIAAGLIYGRFLIKPSDQT